MNLTSHPAFKFDRLLPIYNWIYPLAGRIAEQFNGRKAEGVFQTLAPSKGRALYFHIPFCETICSFCPFVRGKYKNSDVIETYVGALLQEIEIKSRFRPFSDAPVRAIYFGGGTPSLLEPHQIRRIGDALRHHFDLRELSEFSFEFEVKSVTQERIEALVDIGVTHARFGLQTLSSEYRRLFELSATIDQVRRAAKALAGAFPYVSCDVLYGMNGQTVDDLMADIDGVCDLGLHNIDFYPINNLVTQRKLHRAFYVESKEPTNGVTKYYMNLAIRDILRSRGYLPHNGHGYVRVPQQYNAPAVAVTELYSFVYHEHVYGYTFYDLLGFGTNAISSLAGVTVHNTSSRIEYIKAMAEGFLPILVKWHPYSTDACRPVCLRLPYHGVIEKELVDWNTLPPGTSDRLNQLVMAGLLVETDNLFQLTTVGWEWYSCIMYYLLPSEEKRAIDSIIKRAQRDLFRNIERTGLETLQLPGRAPVGSGAVI